MKREPLASPDAMLVGILVFGAALTVYGGLCLLGAPADAEAQTAFGIGIGILFPLTVIIVLRFLVARDGERPPR